MTITFCLHSTKLVQFIMQKSCLMNIAIFEIRETKLSGALIGDIMAVLFTIQKMWTLLVLCIF